MKRPILTPNKLSDIISPQVQIHKLRCFWNNEWWIHYRETNRRPQGQMTSRLIQKNIIDMMDRTWTQIRNLFYFQYSACNTPSQLKTDLGRDSSAFTLQLKSELKDHSFWFVLHDNIFSSPIPKRLPDWPVRFCPNSFVEIFLKKSLFSSFCLKSWDEFDILVRIFRENIRRFFWAVVDIKLIFDKLKVHESSFRVIDSRRTELVIR